MFSNAKSVEINGKTVKSIILENGGILYKKDEPYILSITSDKDILSYYDNDVATLTATLTKNNSPVSNEQVLFYDSDKVSLATYYDWLDVFLFTVTSENQGEIIFDTTNAEHNNFYTEDATSGGGYSNGGRVKFVITDTQVETWRYNSSTDTWTKSFMLYNLPVKIGFAYGTEIISDTAKIPFFASATINNNGEATATYNSIGIGDVSITAECMNLQETYEIEDCTYYKPTQYTQTNVTLNIPLPSHFSLEYVLKQTNSNYSAPYLDIGASSNNRMLVGQYARAGTNGLITYTESQTNYPYSNNPTFDQDNAVHFTYDGTNYTYWLNDLTPMTVSDKGITLTKLIHVEGGRGGYLKDIKIKPL